MARAVLGITIVAVTAALVGPPPAASAAGYSAPTDGQRTTLESTAVEPTAKRQDGGVVAELAPTRTDPYAMVAVTWKRSDRQVEVEIRTHDDNGWSGWRHLETDADGPDGDPTDGTVPLWVGSADGVAARVRTNRGAAPRKVRVLTIDPAGPPAATRGDRLPSAGGPMGKPPRFPGKPPIISRKRWGADPDLGDKCFDPIYGRTTKAAIVHHTAGTNDYRRSDSVGIVQGILAYHTQGRGWCDIGYNFLVDRFGRVFEGRDGGIRKPVRGAHAGDFNTNTVGVSMMGNFDNVRLSRRLKNAMVRLVGWRLGTNYVNPRGTTRMEGIRINRISGHRDVMSTACPGLHGYEWLPLLRTRVHHYLSRFNSKIERKRRNVGFKKIGAVFNGERRIKGGRRTMFNRAAIYWSRGNGAHYIPRGSMLRGYWKRGGAPGRLGYPRGDYVETKRNGVYRLNTKKGRLFRNRGGKVHALRGRIELAYIRRGGVTGRLGTPRTDSKHRRRVATARFAEGRLRYDKRTDKVTVKFW
ncbi:MAG: N-acetylmuramoyl-L-alanine amidase [Actinomycetia bacterium]|nr:N-acetylmuramoyl-L-alanine amidase [Actinomycetes bacterium]